MSMTTAYEESLPVEDEDEIPAERPEPDAVSQAVGALGYVHRYVVQDCVETFDHPTLRRPPERFDRFYFQPERVLVDIIADGLGDGQIREERDRKHVDFKARWCEENGWRYVVLNESDADNLGLIRELAAGRTPAEPKPADVPAKPKPAPRKRGQVSRPKAAE